MWPPSPPLSALMRLRRLSYRLCRISHSQNWPGPSRLSARCKWIGRGQPDERLGRRQTWPGLVRLAHLSREDSSSKSGELLKDVVVLTCSSEAEGGSCDVYLVGTSHCTLIGHFVIAGSYREVEAIVKRLKPQVVFLELCPERASILKSQSVKDWTMADIVKEWKKNHSIFGILVGCLQAEMARELGLPPGCEFHVASEEAKKYGGKVILGDRPQKITLRRISTKVPLWQWAKCLYLCVSHADVIVNEKKDMDMEIPSFFIQEMSKACPTLVDTHLHEHDHSVVAVVGKAHLPGIKKNWLQPITIKDLMETPNQTSAFTTKRMLASLAIAATGAAIGSHWWS